MTDIDKVLIVGFLGGFATGAFWWHLALDDWRRFKKEQRQLDALERQVRADQDDLHEAWKG